jgi:hypothetical protein
MPLDAEKIARLRDSAFDHDWGAELSVPRFATELMEELFAAEHGPQVLGWLALAVARAVLPVWSKFEHAQPLEAALDAITGWLQGTRPRSACRAFVTPAPTWYRDCTECCLECAADTVAAAAAYVADDDPGKVALAIGMAHATMDQSAGDLRRFMEWVADEALPAALQKRLPLPYVHPALARRGSD